MVDDSVVDKIRKISEEIFKTSSDPEQMPVSKEYGDKLQKLSPHWINYKLDDRGEPIAWVVLVPTTKEIAKGFLDKEINERQIADLTQPQKIYSALYFCEAVTMPKCRGRGLATELFKNSVSKIPLTNDAIFFGWPTTEDGRKLALKLEKLFDRDMIIRK